MTTTIEQRITAVVEKAGAVLLTAKAELSRRVIYCTRARVMADATRDTLRAMTELEADGVSSDFPDEWRHMRLTLAYAQTQFQRIIDGAGDHDQPPCHTNSRHWQ
jgi:hypothetical protein